MKAAARWWPFSRRGRRDQELAYELEAHLLHEADELIAGGMSPEHARAAARRKLGNPTRVREEVYEMAALAPLEVLIKDLAYAARLLRRSPAFATTAILSIALGIGANTAIFQLVDAVRLRSLPVAAPQELAEVRIAGRASRTGSFEGRLPFLSYPLWQEIRQHQQAFSGVFAWGNARFDTAAGGEARRAEGLWVSGELFDVLGVSPALGRLLSTEDDRRGCGPPAAVLSYAFWQREHGGDPAVLGRALLLDGQHFLIVGVTAPSFFGVEVGRRFDVALPLCAEDLLAQSGGRLDRRDTWWLAVIGRLQPGWSAEQAAAHLRSISPGIFAATLPPSYQPADAKGYLGFELTALPAASGLSTLRRDSSGALWVMLAITGLVLLIACANIANLLLARASAREREMAVRLAIGASRQRLVRQLLVESLLLALLGAALGALLAGVLARALVALLAPTDAALFVDLAWNGRLFAFTLGLAVLTCLLFGLVPALRTTRTAPGTAMRAGGRGLTASRERLGLRRALVVAQVALSLVLLVGALLFVRTLRNLLTVEVGFEPAGKLVAMLDLRRAADSSERLGMLLRELRERLQAVPGVEAVAQVEIVPLSGSGWNQYVRVDGSAETASEKALSDFNGVSPGYFATVGIPLVAGRDFTDRDSLGAPRVAIVSESFVNRFLAGEPPLGRTVRVEPPAGEPEPAYQIVGVVEDTRFKDLREEPTPLVFVASAQSEEPGGFLQLVLRCRTTTPGGAGVEALKPAVTRAVAEVSPAITLEYSVIETDIRGSLMRERLMALLSSAFGTVAGLLAALGLYGLMSYSAAQRKTEISVRMAMGAARRDVLRLLLGEAGRLVLVGLLLGGVLAAVAATAASSLLFGLRPGDPLSFAIAVILLSAIAAASAAIPALRAARQHPLLGLRED